MASSSQVSGVDTVAIGVWRTEYAAAMVRSRAFWLKSMKIRAPRCSFHHEVVTVSGVRRWTSRASAIPARRTATKSQSGVIRR